MEYFYGTLSRKLGKQPAGIHPDVYELLCTYYFPGNVRELKNIIERAINVSDGKKLLPKHFLSVSSSA